MATEVGHLQQPRFVEEHLWMHNMLTREADTAADDHATCRVCQLRTGNLRLQCAQAHQNCTKLKSVPWWPSLFKAGGIFYWQSLGLLAPPEHHLNTTPTWVLLLTMSIPSWTQWTIFWWRAILLEAIVSPSSDHLRLVSWIWRWAHCTQMTSTLIRSQPSRCGEMGDSHDAVVSVWTKIWGLFPAPRWI